jgi:hypothetical protein
MYVNTICCPHTRTRHRYDFLRHTLTPRTGYLVFCWPTTARLSYWHENEPTNGLNKVTGRFAAIRSHLAMSCLSASAMAELDEVRSSNPLSPQPLGENIPIPAPAQPLPQQPAPPSAAPLEVRSFLNQRTKNVSPSSLPHAVVIKVPQHD